MKNKFLLLFFVFSVFDSILTAEVEQMTPQRILELWNLEDNRSEIPLGFEDWANAKEYKVDLITIKENGQKIKSRAMAEEKIVKGKFIVYRVFIPDAPVDAYGTHSYDKDNDLYYKASYVRGKKGTAADGYERFTSFIGCRYPGSNIYSYTQRENNLPEKTLSFEKQTKKHAEWREILITKDGDFLQQIYGKAIPVRKKALGNNTK